MNHRKLTVCYTSQSLRNAEAGTRCFQTGRVLDYREKGDDNRKLCSMYLSIMDRMGAKLERFGDAEERLAGL